ncbi:hypothetical protein [Planococcus sp. YIM B11945]|uniref:hypothetical protein n=1 Tax=Planococcus sp. YIM B11945 TaxID=3435410 RepID=UPI003D7CC22D
MQEEKNLKTFRYSINHDFLVFFIGISFSLIGLMNIAYKIPVEYIVSISFAGFFFVYADFVEIANENMKKLKMVHSLLLFLGVFSFTALPVYFLVFPELFDLLKKHSDSYTIIALGIVLIIFNIKSNRAKIATFEKVSIDSVELINKYGSLLNVTDDKLTELNSKVETLKVENEKLKRILEGKGI